AAGPEREAVGLRDPHLDRAAEPERHLRDVQPLGELQVREVTLPWRLAQAAALLGLLGAVVALVAAPSLGLRVVWSAAVPVLPAVFLLAPALWRNVCPLATLGTGGAPATPLTTSEWRARLMAT